MRTDLEIELLRTFIAFADTGSFRAASKLVFRSQPAVSMQMKRLEDMIGHKLFERKGRDLVATDIGVQLVAHARRILELHDKAVDEICGEQLDAKIRIGVPDDYAILVLPTILRQFSGGYSDVALEIRSDTSPVLIDMLKGGDLDLAILATDAPDSTDVVLRKEPVVWVSSENGAHVRKPLKLALFSDESPIYRATMRALQRTAKKADKAAAFRISLKSKSCAVLKSAAKSGFAVATMARFIVDPDLKILTEEDGFADLGAIYIVVRSSLDSQSIATSRLSERILDKLRQETSERSDSVKPED